MLVEGRDVGSEVKSHFRASTEGAHDLPAWSVIADTSDLHPHLQMDLIGKNNQDIFWFGR